MLADYSKTVFTTCMSEHSPVDDYNDPIFDQLAEMGSIDTEVFELLEWAAQLESEYARRYGEIVEGDTDSLIEVNNALAEELAKKAEQCSYLNETVAVSGDVIAGHYDERRRTISTSEESFKDTLAVMRGFSAQRYKTSAGDEALRIGYRFETGEMTVLENASDPYSTMILAANAFAAIGAVEIRHSESGIRQRERLMRDYPAIIEAIDACVDTTSDYCEALLRLGKYSFSTNVHMSSTDRQLIENYANGRMNMETEMQHIVIASGPVVLDATKADRLSVGIASGDESAIVRPQKLPFRRLLEQHDDKSVTIMEEWGFLLRSLVVGPERHDDDQPMLVPLMSVDDIRSLRNVISSADQ